MINDYYNQKSRSSVSFLYNNYFKEINTKFRQIKDEDIQDYKYNFFVKKRKTNNTSFSKYDEKFNPCFIY